MFDGPDYELLWPRQLFIEEAKAIAVGDSARYADRVEWLLEEVFVSSIPADEYRAAPKQTKRPAAQFADPWADFDESAASNPEPELTQTEFLAALLERAGTLREAAEPRPYWSVRKSDGTATSEQVFNRTEARNRFVRTVGELTRNGYLERVLPSECVDDSDAVDVDGATLLQERLGKIDLWPLQPENWDDDTFYDLVEVFHDLVARPRERWYHSYGNCGWHYRSFAVAPARALYRWRVNKILTGVGIPLRIARAGEDAGRLVHVVDDDRAVLVDKVLLTAEAPVRDQVRHAIALFRSRSATAQNKRSAVVALAHVLERRRDLLKAELLRSDEGALFRIANEFALRHENERQRSNYDPIFLDWVFWWYLATIELTDRLLQRDEK